MSDTGKPIPVTGDKHVLFAYVLGILGVVGFGATLPATRIALADFTPEFLTFARAAIATAMAAAVLLWYRKPLRHSHNFQIFLAGTFLIFGFPGFMSVAMQTVPAAYGGVVLGFLPLTTAIIARLLTEEKPSGLFWILSISGCVIVTGYILAKAGPDTTSGDWPGYGWLVLAGLTASVGYVIFGKLSRKTAGWEIISRSLVLNMPLTIIGLIWFFDRSFVDPSMPGLSALLYLGSVSMFLAFCAWNAALAMGGIARIGQLQLLQVFVTIALSALLLAEHLDVLTIAAATLITIVIAASRKV
ncbi:MAG: DMT family transporter [Pseudomonadota bacterium]